MPREIQIQPTERERGYLASPKTDAIGKFAKGLLNLVRNYAGMTRNGTVADAARGLTGLLHENDFMVEPEIVYAWLLGQDIPRDTLKDAVASSMPLNGVLGYYETSYENAAASLMDAEGKWPGIEIIPVDEGKARARAEGSRSVDTKRSRRGVHDRIKDRPSLPPRRHQGNILYRELLDTEIEDMINGPKGVATENFFELITCMVRRDYESNAEAADNLEPESWANHDDRDSALGEYIRGEKFPPLSLRNVMRQKLCKNDAERSRFDQLWLGNIKRVLSDPSCDSYTFSSILTTLEKEYFIKALDIVRIQSEEGIEQEEILYFLPRSQGEYLKYVRYANGIGRSEVAHETGCAETTIGDAENLHKSYSVEDNIRRRLCTFYRERDAAQGRGVFFEEAYQSLPGCLPKAQKKSKERVGLEDVPGSIAVQAAELQGFASDVLASRAI